tara:strand:- start:194 stop:802 length:609 start_codon:yes stop_codon:yes gene_type:complete
MNFKIGILDLGLNNLKSLVSFFKQFGEVFLINSDKDDISKFNTLILPGNGKFKTGMDIIKTKNFEKMILNCISSKKTLIGICLGMQLFFDKSEENKNCKGLSLIKGEVKKINSSIYKLPLLGWYDINFKNDNKLVKNSFYFNNNYSVFSDDKQIEYGHIENNENQNICAIIKKKCIYGLQFHPEKSSYNGRILMDKILKNEF